MKLRSPSGVRVRTVPDDQADNYRVQGWTPVDEEAPAARASGKKKGGTAPHDTKEGEGT